MRQRNASYRNQKHNVNSAERLASVVGGLALMANSNLPPRDVNSAVKLGIGGALLARGLTGNCTLYRALGISSDPSTMLEPHVLRNITIERSPDDVYNFWRELGNLPRFLKHVESVDELTPTKSRWVIKTPVTNIEYEAEITQDKEGRLLGWRSLPGATVENYGNVVFRGTPSGGTEVRVHLRYKVPGGTLGKAAAKLGQKGVERIIDEDLQRLKEILEANENSRVEGQPHGNNSEPDREAQPARGA